MKRFAAILLSALVLGGCASTSVPWANPSIPKDQWSRDYSACRRLADRDAGWRDEDNASSSPFKEFDRQQAKRIYEGSLANCMIDRGYVPATRSKD
jgi:hypothetical protein